VRPTTPINLSRTGDGPSPDRCRSMSERLAGQPTTANLAARVWRLHCRTDEGHAGLTGGGPESTLRTRCRH
jgi:hypothetical protein